MRKAIALLIVFMLGYFVTAAQNKIKSWSIAGSLIGTSLSAAESVIKKHGYEFDSEKEKLGIKYKTYINADLKLFHPWQKDYFDEVSIGLKNGKVILIECLIGETEEDESNTAHKDFRQFERDIKAAGFAQYHTMKREDSDLSKFFNNAESKLSILIDLHIEDRLVVAAQVLIHEQEVDFGGEKKDAAEDEDPLASFTTLAAYLNKNMTKATIYNNPTSAYKFEVLGKTDFDKRSIEFIAENDGLYLQMNIPRNGTCDYGLKKIKAKWGRRSGGTSGTPGETWYCTWKYTYTCKTNLEDIFITFKTTPSVTPERLLQRIKDYDN